MRKRVFIAINLPSHVKKEVKKLADFTVQLNSKIDFKAVPPSNYHITLYFLGYLKLDQIPLLESIIAETCVLFQPFSLKIGRLIGFPSSDYTRIVALEIEKMDDTLDRFREKMNQKLIDKNFSVEERSFIPHITLARLRRPEKINWPRIDPLKRIIPVTHIDLMESLLKPQGAKYKLISRFILGDEK